MNVYVLNTALEMGKRGIAVDIFTRATRPSQGEIITLTDRVRVINIAAGPYEGLSKSELPTQLIAFSRGDIEFQKREGVTYDAIHSHYWLSGQVGWLLQDLWNAPLVHTAHTLALVKNSALSPGDTPEPESRRICEQQLVDNADRLIVNTVDESQNLVMHYDADCAQIDVVPPGADVELFCPGSDRATERTRRLLGIPLHSKVIAFVGRIQRLKGPHILLQAVAQVLEEDPSLPIHVLICGGASGNGYHGGDTLEGMAQELGISRRVRFLQPRPPQELVDIYRAADIVAVPSFNESFGLVAVEAQASGTPVVAARVGGLPLAVVDGETGVLVPGHDIDQWARALGDLVRDDERRIAMGERAVAHAQQYSWAATAERLDASLSKVVRERQQCL